MRDLTALVAQHVLLDDEQVTDANRLDAAVTRRHGRPGRADVVRPLGGADERAADLHELGDGGLDAARSGRLGLHARRVQRLHDLGQRRGGGVDPQQPQRLAHVAGQALDRARPQVPRGLCGDVVYERRVTAVAAVADLALQPADAGGEAGDRLLRRARRLFGVEVLGPHRAHGGDRVLDPAQLLVLVVAGWLLGARGGLRLRTGVRTLGVREPAVRVAAFVVVLGLERRHLQRSQLHRVGALGQPPQRVVPLSRGGEAAGVDVRRPRHQLGRHQRVGESALLRGEPVVAREVRGPLAGVRLHQVLQLRSRQGAGVQGRADGEGEVAVAQAVGAPQQRLRAEQLDGLAASQLAPAAGVEVARLEHLDVAVGRKVGGPKQQEAEQVVHRGLLVWAVITASPRKSRQRGS
ncbi:hypothetical protein [Angustibacter sp. Root456]|uniref:hypothetical protein n=1 Tax=Angustibacter sp. Root456 TaxID=1736539 RepID=UPI0006F785B5|nr:hypothetical protein [Angustibacter sp. Root456]KQX61743.1 hypothetical protein ASD06_14250 [Angustibacter sp. Root456]